MLRLWLLITFWLISDLSFFLLLFVSRRQTQQSMHKQWYKLITAENGDSNFNLFSPPLQTELPSGEWRYTFSFINISETNEVRLLMPTKWFGLKEPRERERNQEKWVWVLKLSVCVHSSKRASVQLSVTQNLYSFEGNRQPHKPISSKHWLSMIGAASSPKFVRITIYNDGRRFWKTKPLLRKHYWGRIYVCTENLPL